MSSWDEKFIALVASENILEGIKRLFLSEDDYRKLYQTFYADIDFFEGLGKYFNASDNDAGYELFRRKLERMEEKLKDDDKAYTFDLLEENILYNCIEETKDGIKSGKYVSDVDTKKEKKLAAVLTAKYKMKPRLSNWLARKVCRFSEMNLKDDEDDNLFFWDDDYIFYFRNGFVSGIREIKSYIGEMQGYGYDSACTIFSDVGMNVPMRLLGTQYANQIANEKQAKNYIERMNRRLGDAKGRKDIPKKEDPLEDQNT